MSNFLNKIGLDILVSAQNMKQAFTIPPDMDDSSVSLALLAFMKETLSPHHEFWNSFNLKKQEFYDKALKYAYRPFGVNQTLELMRLIRGPTLFYISFSKERKPNQITLQ